MSESITHLIQKINQSTVKLQEIKDDIKILFEKDKTIAEDLLLQELAFEIRLDTHRLQSRITKLKYQIENEKMVVEEVE